MQMQISTDYAIRILQYLHENGNGEELHTAMHIAQAIGITYPFFIKIANLLKQRGLICAVQGRNGGYRITGPAHEVSVYDVYLCMEGALQINRCFKSEDEPCTNGNKEDCKVRGFLSRLQNDVIIAEMSKKKIADLIHAGEGSAEKNCHPNSSATDKDLQRLQDHFNATA